MNGSSKHKSNHNSIGRNEGNSKNNNNDDKDKDRGSNQVLK
jgi:hypothetical protein